LTYPHAVVGEFILSGRLTTAAAPTNITVMGSGKFDATNNTTATLHPSTAAAASRLDDFNRQHLHSGGFAGGGFKFTNAEGATTLGSTTIKYGCVPPRVRAAAPQHLK
jgi:hypothetical protein